MSFINDIREVVNLSVRVGILHQNTAHVIVELKLVAVLNDDLHPQVLGPGGHHGNGLGMAARVDKKHVPVVLRLPVSTS